MRTAWAAALLLTACPLTVAWSDAPAVELATAARPAPINPLAFAARYPLPVQPSYLQIIKYIDDGMKYIDPLSQFFISPAGEMCFRTRPNYPQIIYEAFHKDWCIYPQTVDRVEAAPNVVRLWCMRAYPQCAHAIGQLGWIANSISVETVDYQQERAALESLINVMSGNVRFTPPSGVSDGLR
jgi:hypothetical protein